MKWNILGRVVLSLYDYLPIFPGYYLGRECGSSFSYL